MKQFLLTPAAGKRLIGKAMARHPEIRKVLKKGTLAIIAGTTNGYIAEEILAAVGAGAGFSRERFFRGITLPPHYKTTVTGRLKDEAGFPGDVVIRDGLWLEGKTIFDVRDELKEGDVVLKGANALDMTRRRAAVLIGNPDGGTIIAVLQAALGRRARIILPVGIEKRVPGDLDSVAQMLNAPGAKGLRLMPVPGEVFTELEAIELLTGTRAEVAAAGGVLGAEGGAWITICGTAESEEAAEKTLKAVAAEPLFAVGIARNNDKPE